MNQYTDSLDAFSRTRVSTPTGLFDAQFTFDLAPLIFEQITAQSGATVTHDATNRCAVMTFEATPNTGKAFMQGYESVRYQPGKSQQVFITFNMQGGATNVLKFAGLSDGTNGIEFQMSETTPQIVILSNTDNGSQTFTQADWNLDRMDGRGKSGVNLDFSAGQILVIDFQALYTGRVRVGFNVNGVMYYAHEFDHANNDAVNYIATANLPVRCGMTCTGTATTTMLFNCCSVISEGGQEDVAGYSFTAEGTATAGSGARTHILSLRPKTTFNSIATREKFVLDSIDIMVTGVNPVYWELCVGQALNSTTDYADVNTTYSGYEYNTLGTLSGNPAIVIASGYAAAAAARPAQVAPRLANRYPITLNAAGAVRALGTLTLIVTGLGGTSTCRAAMNWHEIR